MELTDLKPVYVMHESKNFSSIKLVLNCFMQLPEDPDSSGTDELCTEQPEGLLGRDSAELSIHQLEDKTDAASGGPLTPSAQDVESKPETAECAHQGNTGILPTACILCQKPSEVALCDRCGKGILQKNLKRHQKCVHEGKKVRSHKPGRGGICVDSKQGIYMVPKSVQGNQHPIHVQYCVSKAVQKVTCQLDECVSLMRNATGPTVYCRHVEYISRADTPPNQGYCQDSTLTGLMAEGIIAATYEQELREKRDESLAAGSPDVVSWHPGGQYLYLSVFHGTSHTAHLDGLGRVVVRYHTVSYTLDCKCCDRKRDCLHKRMALWHLSQVWPGLVQQTACGTKDEEVECYLLQVDDQEEVNRHIAQVVVGLLLFQH